MYADYTSGTTMQDDMSMMKMQMRFVAYDPIANVTAEDPFMIEIQGTEQDRSDLCQSNFDALTIVDPMSGNRDYQILEDGVENWQFFYIDSTVGGIDDLKECRWEMYMALDYNVGGVWKELWSDMKPSTDGLNVYIEEDDNSRKIWLMLSQTEFETKVKVEFDIKENFHAVPMRVAFKKLNGGVISNLSTGEFTITIKGLEKEDDYVHPCAQVSLTKKSQAIDGKQVFFDKHWSSNFDQMVDVQVQGALQVVQSDATVDCDVVYTYQVYSETKQKYIDYESEI
jgi:hypothetical protein